MRLHPFRVPYANLLVDHMFLCQRAVNKRKSGPASAHWPQNCIESQENAAQAHHDSIECVCPYRAARDAEAKRIADRAAMLAARRVNNRAALKPEPAAGSTGTTALRIRLPDGSTHMRRFMSEASLQVCTTCSLLQWPNSQIAAYGLLSKRLHG